MKAPPPHQGLSQSHTAGLQLLQAGVPTGCHEWGQGPHQAGVIHLRVSNLLLDLEYLFTAVARKEQVTLCR